MTRLGIIGAGRIAKSHLDAAAEVGFDLSFICGTPNSRRARKLADQFPELVFKNDVTSLLKEEVDAYVLLLPPQENEAVLGVLLNKEKPVLIEKPVFINSGIFEKIPLHQRKFVKVAYNRRFYSSVEEFRNKIRDISGFVDVIVPELSQINEITEKDIESIVLENTVHVFDLLRFVFGDFDIDSLPQSPSRGKGLFISRRIKFSREYEGIITILFGVPENYSIQCWSAGLTLTLSPLEEIAIVRKIRVVASDSDPSQKHYEKIFEPWAKPAEDRDFKPGFVKQYLEFKQFVDGLNVGSTLATLDDAQQALICAETMLGFGIEKVHG